MYKFSNLLLMTVFSLFLEPLLCLCITLMSSLFSLDQSSQMFVISKNKLLIFLIFLVCLYFLIYHFQLLYVFPSLDTPFLSFLSQMLRFSVFFTKVSVSPFDCGRRTCLFKIKSQLEL